MALKVLQANINHSARAQDLLVHSMKEWSIAIAIVAEPYSVPTRDNWTGDREGTVAIVTEAAAGFPPVERVIKGRGCAAVLAGGIAYIGVYFSPNKSLADFETWLSEVESLVHQCRPHEVLVAGDFNAKSAMWRSPVVNARAEPVEEWATATGLLLLNQGAVHTCVRQRGSSIVDLTFASPALARRVQDWEVLEGVETLSDHRYIRLVLSPPGVPSGPSRSPTELAPRWALKSMDAEFLLEASIVQSWTPRPEGAVEVDAEAEWFREALTDVCDSAMPRVKSLPSSRSVYWWTPELASLRKDCVAARRLYTRQRRRRRVDEDRENELYASYREVRTSFQREIARAKDAARERMLEDLNRDPWGRPYRMVRNKIRAWAPPLTQTMEPDLLDNVVATLFPQAGEHSTPVMAAPADSEVVEEEDVPPVSEGELAAAVRRLRAKNTAPGPDGIPGRAWVLALEALEPRFRELLTSCLEQGRFPSQWKTGKLVLLRKEGRPADSPGAYRPIVLLDEAGKLLERVIAARLNKHLERIGPNLAESQFGFRRGRSTIDAISRVRDFAEEAVSQGKVVLAVSLDIANAFNTIPWDVIKEALRFHATPSYLCRTLDHYLMDRHVVYPTREGWGQWAMSCGVPQGSVDGPVLWNIGFDWVLRGYNLPGIEVVCYADDTLVLARGNTYRETAILATAGTAQVVSRIRRLGLQVALNKSEAICFHGPRKAPPAGSELVVGGVPIGVGSTMKYLGLVLDSRWNFKEHFKQLVPRLTRAASALGSLLPSVGGPNAACRRLYTGVVRSMALYGAPIWADALSAHNTTLLRRPQRFMALRAIRAYRTVSYEAACVLAGSTPWDLDAEMLARFYHQLSDARSRGEFPPPEVIRRWRKRGRQRAMTRWRRRLDEPSAGHRTVEAFRPSLKEWVDREHGALSFRLVQVLSGHGCFGEYLYRVAGREPTPACHHCGGTEDTAQHTLEACPEWDRERMRLVAEVGADLSLPAIASAMTDSESAWDAVRDFCEEVVSRKELAERGREDDVSSHPMRRRRVARRRLAHERRLPP